MWTRLELTLRRSVLMAASLVALLLLWPAPGFPHAGNSNPDDVHACITKLTQVVRIVGVNGHCLTHPAVLAETPVHWPGVASAPATQSLSFVDETGKVIGEAIESSRAVIDLGGGTLITVGLFRSGFEETPEELLFYESTDCTGQGFLDADTASNFAAVRGSTATYRDFAAAITATIRSIFFPRSRCVPVEPTLTLVAPPLRFDLSTLGLVPPFTLAK